VDRNEDGSPAIENTRCAQPGCEVYLCRAGCLELSFQCESCDQRFCVEHRMMLDGMAFCVTCAVAVTEDEEPECTCRRADVDLFDARGCELHDITSQWNTRLRAAREIGHYRREIA